VWEEVRQQVEANPGLEAKTLFEALQRKYPGRFADGQLHTLQRRIKRWRATEGPGREVFFAQKHVPGRLGESDFTYMNELGITIGGRSFPHMLYHFVLAHSNWEDVTLCFSESFESLSEGLQNALWNLGGVPLEHRTDRLSTAVNNMSDEKEFTARYDALLRHYRLAGQKIQAGKANENGDVEQRHHRLKRAVEQAVLLRGSRDFASVAHYREFLERLVEQLNAGRRERLKVEMQYLRALPERRLESAKRVEVRVARRLRELPLSRRVVSDEPVPHGLGRTARGGADAGQQALPGHLAGGGAGRRGARGRRAPRVAGGRRDRRREAERRCDWCRAEPGSRRATRHWRSGGGGAAGHFR